MTNNGNGRGRKLLAGSIIIGGVGLLAYYFIVKPAAAQGGTPPGKTPGTPTTPPPDTGAGKTPPSTPPVPPPPTPATMGAMNLAVTINGQYDLGDTYFWVKDGNGHWYGAFPIRDGHACVPQLAPGWGEIRVAKNGTGAIPGISNGWGGFDTGNETIYISSGFRTRVTLAVDDTRPGPFTYSQEASAPAC